MMKNRIRGELTLSEAIEEQGKGKKVIVLRRQPADMGRNDFLIEELEDYIEGCHLLLIESPEKPEHLPGEESTTLEPEPSQVRKEQQTKPKKKVDVGRIKALYEAGKSQKWIADDMRISESTVSGYIRKLRAEGELNENKRGQRHD